MKHPTQNAFGCNLVKCLLSLELSILFKWQMILHLLVLFILHLKCLTCSVVVSFDFVNFAFDRWKEICFARQFVLKRRTFDCYFVLFLSVLIKILFFCLFNLQNKYLFPLILKHPLILCYEILLKQPRKNPQLKRVHPTCPEAMLGKSQAEIPLKLKFLIMWDNSKAIIMERESAS